MSVAFKIAKTQKELETCFEIRKKVFIEEQNVSEEEERDDHDQNAEHFLLIYNEKPVATARTLKKDGQTGKIGRVAVLKNYRGKGFGKILIKKIIEHSKKSEIKKLIMNAQTQVIPFYEKLCFKKFGEEFLDANIPHYKMELEI